MSDLTISSFYDGKKMKQPPVTESFYEPRNPKAGHYYQCIEANFEELEMVWDDRYERRYGYSSHIQVFGSQEVRGHKD